MLTVLLVNFFHGNPFDLCKNVNVVYYLLSRVVFQFTLQVIAAQISHIFIPNLIISSSKLFENLEEVLRIAIKSHELRTERIKDSLYLMSLLIFGRFSSI